MPYYKYAYLDIYLYMCVKAYLNFNLLYNITKKLVR